MRIHYVTLIGNREYKLSLEEAEYYASPSVFFDQITFSRWVMENNKLRLATEKELSKLPKEGDGVKHLRYDPAKEAELFPSLRNLSK